MYQNYINSVNRLISKWRDRNLVDLVHWQKAGHNQCIAIQSRTRGLSPLSDRFWCSVLRPTDNQYTAAGRPDSGLKPTVEVNFRASLQSTDNCYRIPATICRVPASVYRKREVGLLSHGQRRSLRRFLPESPAEWILYAGLLCVIIAGALMRLFKLGDHPYGLYQDEAINGLDALRVLGGEYPLYFEANNGREPLFTYLVAGTIGLFGRTPLGIRAAASILGILTLPAIYLLGQRWANRRVGLLSAAILAAMLWHVHLSRIGFRAVALPLFSALALGWGAHSLKTRSRGAAIGAGVAYGLSFYTYLPARFTPAALAAMLVYGLIWHRDWLRERWRLLVWIGVVALVTIIPLIDVAVMQPDIVFRRSGQVAIWSETIHQGDPVGTALRSGLSALGMFTWRGDGIWRHNVPGRPVFDPLLSIAFITGAILSIARWRSRPALALSLIWVAVMTLPTALAEDAPHFLRGVGVLPVVVLLPALALDAGLDWLTHSIGYRRDTALPCPGEALPCPGEALPCPYGCPIKLSRLTKGE